MPMVSRKIIQSRKEYVIVSVLILKINYVIHADMGQLHDVDIIVSNKQTTETYYAKSYPYRVMEGDGKVALYGVPVYYVYIEGNGKRYTWKALRFMPYYNPDEDGDGIGYDSRYRTTGWVNCGLHKLSRQPAPRYIKDYGTHNVVSPYSGAIVLKSTFYIHAGPEDLRNIGWGSAGCVEIIGSFNKFKEQIKELSGSTKDNADGAISELVSNRKLYITVEHAIPPQIEKNRFYR